MKSNQSPEQWFELYPHLWHYPGCIVNIFDSELLFSSLAVILRGLVLSYSWKCTIQYLPERGDALITKYTIRCINPSFQETHLRHK